MIRALFGTATRICANEKAAYSFLNMIGACVLHLYFNVDVQDALLLVSPLSLLTVSQAYVDALAARQPRQPRSGASGAVPFPSEPGAHDAPSIPLP